MFARLGVALEGVRLRPCALLANCPADDCETADAGHQIGSPTQPTALELIAQ